MQVLMDELVRPEAPITDYVTRYSGITPAMMADVTTSLADVQARTLSRCHVNIHLINVGSGMTCASIDGSKCHGMQTDAGVSSVHATVCTSA